MSLVDEVAGGLDGLSQLRAPRAEALGHRRRGGPEPNL